MGSDEPSEKEPAWLWPAGWASERSFWREVSARTISGVLTICIVGLPALLAANTLGSIDEQTTMTIFFGFSVAVLTLGSYTMLLAQLEVQRALLRRDALADNPSADEVPARVREAEHKALKSMRPRLIRFAVGSCVWLAFVLVATRVMFSN